MKKYLKIKEQLYLVTLDLEDGTTPIKHVWDYNPLDSFLIDYNNLAIKSVSADDFIGNLACLFTSKLLGDEEEVCLRTDHFLRPSHREPLLRGLYATVFRHGRGGIGKQVLLTLGDTYLESLKGEKIISLAHSCVFSAKERLIQGRVQKLI